MKEVILKNFKCLENVRMKVGGLTLLAGLNGMGKSSYFRRYYYSGNLANCLADAASHTSSSTAIG